MIVHHVLSLFGMLNMAFQGKWGTELIGVIGGTEITNPLLQLRWFLKTLNFNSLLVSFVDFSFIFTFGYFRLYLGGHVLVHYVTYPKWDFLGKLGAVTMYALSVVFYYYILRYAARKYGGFLSKKKKLVSSNGVHKHSSNGCASPNGHVLSNEHLQSNGNHAKTD